jgi:hypothetical protein
MLNERANYDKEEIRDKMYGLNAHMTTEFQRKDEAMTSLQELID